MSTTTTATPPHHHHTFWCHECDMSVFLLHLPPTDPPRCPHCHSDFLEQMDSFTPALLPQFPNHPDSNPNLEELISTDLNTATTFTPSDDNFLLDSPYLHRLIHHLTTANDAPIPNRQHSPASKAAVEALEGIKVSSLMLENDPVIPCPVCKDNFLLDVEVKMLPCKHMYHSDCILPWLEVNNSCPVCRFKLPTEEEDDEECIRRRERFLGAMRLGEILAEEEDLFGFRRTLRRVARRHQLDGGESTIGQAGQGVGVVARANSVETVSSWPSWPVENGSDGDEVGGSGNRLGGGEGDTTVVRS
ncbi:E3 ubiquitin-protein ligase RING1-like [Nicotiana tabacum]|uniref:RING-type E3 ubiquitin transferase n=3 Tax=Nicotiana TaxID=4085 RepID=A0A1S4A0U8_TOBAC|nr:PREDICTED: E3 ubiquitin-protein ligase RING1-like [Nicotiana sylvestris]XP_009785031.1 PREDICTED: E3 ubiquitin-protein ligase RING1-like [Nicotiana sylvestris]XP_016470307.1 PREDICTED: E3 ubiquitin-protein ligase RING1-like [Nicotiana tabacum]